MTATGANIDVSPAVIRYRYTLRQLVIYLSQESTNSEASSTLCMSLQQALIKLATTQLNDSTSAGVFPELIVLMDILSSSGNGQAYASLFEACCAWLEQLTFARQLDISSADSNSGLIKSVSFILSYVCETLNIVKGSQAARPIGTDLTCVEQSVTDEINRLVQKKLKVDFYQDTFKLLDQVKANLIDSSEYGDELGGSRRGEKKKSSSLWSRTSFKRPRKSSLAKKDTKSTGVSVEKNETNPFGEETEEGDEEQLTEEAVVAAPGNHDHDDDDEDNFYDDLNIDDTYNDQDEEEDDNDDLDGGKTKRNENQDDEDGEDAGGHNDNDDDDDDDDNNGYYNFDEKSNFNARLDVMFKNRLLPSTNAARFVFYCVSHFTVLKLYIVNKYRIYSL